MLEKLIFPRVRGVAEWLPSWQSGCPGGGVAIQVGSREKLFCLFPWDISQQQSQTLSLSG
ncbi:MAG TPA: hypothetical protein DEP38_15880 [Cyanobacteria bacterium UBA9226]|nr:hypothetical protein [Cyanobacteria bacterium UBA11166]HCA96037.1 hypothetical protein [Cyanobacteria bacterium UBA9226]